MMDKIRKYKFFQIIIFLLFVFINLFSAEEALTAPPPCNYGGCYLELNYPKYLHVSKPGVGELYAKYLGKGEYVGNEAVEKVYAETPQIRNMSLIWYPKEAVGKTVDVIVALHGWRTLSKPGNNEFVYSTADNFKQFDKIVRKYMDKGLAEPIVIVAPMYDKGYHDSVWKNTTAYNTKGLLDAAKKAIADAGLKIEFKRVSVLGHSNANCGGGLARTAKELAGYNLYLYMAADGTCADDENGTFFNDYNVFDIVKNKGGIIFHLHQNNKIKNSLVSDVRAVAEIKSQQGGGLDPEAVNKSEYSETWKSNDGKIFTYGLTAGSGAYGPHDHTQAPKYLLAEVLPRFFGKTPYDPNAHPPIAGSASTGNTGNQNPAENASALDDLFRSYDGKQLTDDELQKFLQKPVPRIKLPGLNFSDITLENLQSAADGGYIYFPFLGEYISALYKYIIVVIGVVAVIMLIVAGLQWMLPGGEAENISSAKKRIEQAIVGLIIAVSSYSILFIINPELVNFRSLRVRYISPVPPFGTPGYAEGEEGSIPGEAIQSISSKCIYDTFFSGYGLGQKIPTKTVEMFGLGKKGNVKVYEKVADAFKKTSDDILASTDPEVKGYLQYMKDFSEKKAPDMTGLNDGAGTVSVDIGPYGFGKLRDSNKATDCLTCDMHTIGMAVDIMTRSNWDIKWDNNKRGDPAGPYCEKYQKTLQKMKDGTYGAYLKGDPYHMFDRLTKKIQSCFNKFDDGNNPYTSIPRGFADIFIANGFKWLGNGKRMRTDSMHFEYVGACANTKGDLDLSKMVGSNTGKNGFCCNMPPDGNTKYSVNSEDDCIFIGGQYADATGMCPGATTATKMCCFETDGTKKTVTSAGECTSAGGAFGHVGECK